ncbi:hypothetical protein ACFLS1_12395 [Verrucomicrobiota bacterium]
MNRSIYSFCLILILILIPVIPLHASEFFAVAAGQDINTGGLPGPASCMHAFPSVADWNNNGLDDLVVGYASIENNDGRIFILNNSSGTGTLNLDAPVPVLANAQVLSVSGSI